MHQKSPIGPLRKGVCSVRGGTHPPRRKATEKERLHFFQASCTIKSSRPRNTSAPEGQRRPTVSGEQWAADSGQVCRGVDGARGHARQVAGQEKQAYTYIASQAQLGEAQAHSTSQISLFWICLSFGSVSLFGSVF